MSDDHRLELTEEGRAELDAMIKQAKEKIAQETEEERDAALWDDLHCCAGSLEEQERIAKETGSSTPLWPTRSAKE